jgi:hypothetical protein
MTLQLRSCLTPSMLTRHSKQIPMPQRGPRDSPVTDVRNAVTPEFKIAAARVVPSSTVILLLLTVMVINAF